MDDPFRPKGIYRPKAQRLSISLAPLVAQRSLLFRVRTDLAATTKTNYGELTPTEESPALYTLTPSASARLMSAALSALSVMSSGSIYSQESWKPSSAFIPIVSIDPRRHAIAFSPSLQWSDMLERPYTKRISDSSSDSTNSSLILRTPPGSLQPAPVFLSILPEQMRTSRRVEVDASAPKNVVGMDFPVKMDVSPPANANIDDHKEAPTAGPSKKLQKKKDNRLSKPAKAFGKKVITHLSMQPAPKKDVGGSHYRKTMNIIHRTPEYTLPELGVQLSPMRVEFKASRSPPGAAPAGPSYLALRAPVLPVREQQTPAIPDAEALERIRLIRATMPPPPPVRDPIVTVRRSTIPPPSRSTQVNRPTIPPPPPAATPGTPTAATGPATLSRTPAKKGHRRYKSSPAVAQFDFNRRWDTENMPPVPPMPPMPPKLSMPPMPRTPGIGIGLDNSPLSAARPRPRARSISVSARPQGLIIPDVLPPFPPPFPRHTQI